jgi:hypothetical protein
MADCYPVTSFISRGYYFPDIQQFLTASGRQNRREGLVSDIFKSLQN